MIRREAIRQQKIALPSDDEIRSWRCPRGTDFKRQMTSALYEYSRDRIDVLDRRVQGKDKTKSLPAKSPDIAHAFILGVRHYLRQTMLEEPVEPPRDQGDVLWRKVQEAVNREIAPKFIDPYRRRR